MASMYALPMVLVGLVDGLLIWGTNMIFNKKTVRLRAVLGASIGSIHTLLCLLPGFSFLDAGIWRVIMLAAAGCIAFDMDIRPTALYCLMNMSLGGLVSYMRQGNMVDIVITAILIGLLCFLGFQTKRGKGIYIPVQVPTSHGMVFMTALADTGHSLCDPLTGQPVLVASAQMGSRLLGVEQSVFSKPISAMEMHPGLRLIPYTTIGGKGMLLAKKFQKVKIGEKMQDVLIAFSPMDIGKGKGFNALTGGRFA